jgi:protein TonB
MSRFVLFSLLAHATVFAAYVWTSETKPVFTPPPLSTNIELEQPVASAELKPEEVTKKDSLINKIKKNILKKLKPLAKEKKTKPKTSHKGKPQEELIYGQKLQAFIEKNRFYPQKALRLKQEGTVKLMITILKNGSFEKVEVIKSSNYKILDKATQQLVSSLKSFQPLPNQNFEKQEFTVPVGYKVKE